MLRPYQLAVWAVDPMPLHLPWVLHSASWWRAVTKAALEARR